MVARRLLLAVLIAAFRYGSASAQVLTQCIVATDGPDSLLFKSQYLQLDVHGNYRYIRPLSDGRSYLMVNGRPQGPFTTIDFRSIRWDAGRILSTCDTNHPELPWYYANYAGAAPLYGPVRGKLINCQASRNGCDRCVAITTQYQDSLSGYINGRLVYRVRREEPKRPPPVVKPPAFTQISSIDDSIGGSGNRRLGVGPRSSSMFETGRRYNLSISLPPSSPIAAAFSTNGRALYVVEDQAGRKALHLDDSLIHTGARRYEVMGINNRGDYLFTTDSPSRDYKFSVHTRDSVYGPVDWMGHHALNEAGGWYTQGNNGSMSSPALINGVSTRYIGDPYYIRLAGRRYSVAVNKPGDSRYLMVNGEVVRMPYQYQDVAYRDVAYPAIDTAGHYACYVMCSDLNYYRFVDGREMGSPLIRNGVRAQPLYISPTGVSVHLFRTNDSVYLYRDDSMLISPFAAKPRPYTEDAGRLMPGLNRHHDGESCPLLYVAAGSEAYFLWKGTLSRPMLPPRYADNYRLNPARPGDIVAGKEGDTDFFVIQHTGARKYRININNAVYHDFEGPDVILPDAAFLEECRLTFYGFRDSGLYQYTLTW